MERGEEASDTHPPSTAASSTLRAEGLIAFSRVTIACRFSSPRSKEFSRPDFYFWSNQSQRRNGYTCCLMTEDFVVRMKNSRQTFSFRPIKTKDVFLFFVFLFFVRTKNRGQTLILYQLKVKIIGYTRCLMAGFCSACEG